MSRMINQLDKWFYPNYQSNWDDQIFRQAILSHITVEAKVLDLGAGAGIVPAMNFRGLCAQVCGIDPDQRVLNNPYLDKATVGTGETIPYCDNYFDIVIADNVVEHLKNPEKVFYEINRILKPGGKFFFKTPNLWHYMPTIARATPHKFHQYITKKIKNRANVDTFPTLYLANTPKKIHAIAQKTNFTTEKIFLFEGRPEYLRFSIPTYFLGYLWEQCVNRYQLFSKFRILIIAYLQKK